MLVVVVRALIERFRPGHGAITARTPYGPDLGRASSQPAFIRRMTATPQPIVTAGKFEMSSCFDFLSGGNQGEAAFFAGLFDPKKCSICPMRSGLRSSSSRIE